MNVHSQTNPMNQSKEIPLADQRTAEILESARAAFSEKGFDGASMQDLARKAGMSVGNFYRYFPSKAAIVSALIAQNMVEMEQDFAAILEEDDPLAAFRSRIAARIEEARCRAEGQLWAEITAASLRKPEICEVACKMEDEIIRHLVRVFAHITQRGTDEAYLLWSTHARLIVMLFKSCAMQRPNLPELANLEALVLRTIDRTLEDISLIAAKG